MKKGNPHTIKGKGFDVHPENINTKGRTVGIRNRSTVLKELIALNIELENPLTGKIETAETEVMMNLALLKKALSGDVNAIKEVNDTLYGKVADKTELKTEGDILIKLIKGGKH